jgi:hypothetical protein
MQYVAPRIVKVQNTPKAIFLIIDSLLGCSSNQCQIAGNFKELISATLYHIPDKLQISIHASKKPLLWGLF